MSVPPTIYHRQMNQTQLSELTEKVNSLTLSLERRGKEMANLNDKFNNFKHELVNMKLKIENEELISENNNLKEINNTLIKIVDRLSESRKSESKKTNGFCLTFFVILALLAMVFFIVSSVAIFDYDCSSPPPQ